MCYKDNIETATDVTGEYLSENVGDGLYLIKQWNSQYETSSSIKDIMSTLGYAEKYEFVLSHIKHRIGIDEIGIIECHIPLVGQDADQTRQKLLDFSIHDAETGNVSLVGGILLDHGKVSFHT